MSIGEIIRQKKEGKHWWENQYSSKIYCDRQININLSCAQCFLSDTLVKINGNSKLVQSTGMKSCNYYTFSPEKPTDVRVTTSKSAADRLLLIKDWNLHVVSMTEMVSLSDSSLKTAVNRTSYPVDGFKPVRTYLLLLPLKMTYSRETQCSFYCFVKIYSHSMNWVNVFIIEHITVFPNWYSSWHVSSCQPLLNCWGSFFLVLTSFASPPVNGTHDSL